MRRRHLLALVILALVVATVVASWDALTLRTVEEVIPTVGTAHFHVRFWNDRIRLNAVGTITFRDSHGNRIQTARKLRDGREEITQWEGDEIRGRHFSTSLDGVLWFDAFAPRVQVQTMRRHGVPTETRTSPPWFTDEEILQAVEGAEE